MAEALVNPAVLRWARLRAGLAEEALAAKIGTKPEKVTDWEAGLRRPTFRQAEKYAQATHVPFGYLFLPEPPKEEVSIPDLRTGAGVHAPQLNADFLDALQDVQFKLDWYKEYRLDHGHEPLPFVGRFSLPVAFAEVAEDMRRTLGLSAEDRNRARGWEDYFRLLVGKAENVGIWVMRNGIVGGNTSRPLDTGLFRGFAISDALVPLIFVNGRDARAAQVFTLAHELAHIWLGESGVSDAFRTELAEQGTQTDVEVACNKIAAEFLVPKAEFAAAWDPKAGLQNNAHRLCTLFRVSRIVIAVRAKELGYVGASEFNVFFQQERLQWQRERDENSGGGSYYRNAKARNGDRFLSAVLSSAMSGDLLLRNAGALLNMTPKSVREAYRRQQAGQL